jgi:hypothetical protein
MMPGSAAFAIGVRLGYLNGDRGINRDCGAAEIRRFAENAPRWPDVNTSAVVPPRAVETYPLGKTSRGLSPQRSSLRTSLICYICARPDSQSPWVRFRAGWLGAGAGRHETRQRRPQSHRPLTRSAVAPTVSGGRPETYTHSELFRV